MNTIAEIGDRIKQPPTNGNGRKPPTRPNLIIPPGVTIPALGDLEITHPHLMGAIQTCRKWRTRRQNVPNASLVLIGPCGTGKTTILETLMWAELNIIILDDGETIFQGREGMVFNANNALQRLGGDTHPMSIFGRRKIIGIDDVGRGDPLKFVPKESQETSRHFRYQKIFDYAYRAGVSLVLAVNIPPNELKAEIGDAAHSRLDEMAPKGYIYDMGKVPSYRKIRSGR